MIKAERLKAILTELNGVLVAFSGGVDSSLLLQIAREVLPLPGRVLAVTAVAATYPEHELAVARQVAARIGVEHLLLETAELEQPEFIQNSPDRCYYCKKELFTQLQRLGAERSLVVVDGANHDDLQDFRPGRRAAVELGVRSPLQEAGLTKKEIRAWAREIGLPNWGQPAYACLASRFPYGMPLTKPGLQRVAAGEVELRRLGLGQLRLRDYGDLARIEVEPDQLELAWGQRQMIVDSLKALGYRYITLDLEGYRSGSMNPGWEAPPKPG